MLSDGVVTLRSWTEADAPAIVDCVADDAEMAGWLDRLPQPYTLADARLYIEHDGEETFAVTEADSERVVVAPATARSRPLAISAMVLRPTIQPSAS